jgi:hypothetical protein
MWGAAAAASMLLTIYLGDCTRDKDSGGWAGFRYWHLRRTDSGLPAPLFPVRVGGKFGFINSAGEVVIAPQFERVGRFQEGLCAATQSGGDGYIDGAGTWAIAPRFVMAGAFREGRAAVRDSYDGKYGYVDPKGTLVIPHKYDTASDFVNGVARVGFATKLGMIKGAVADVGVECWYEYIDLHGRRVAKPPMSSLSPTEDPAP